MKILLLGDGNFSFSLALCELLSKGTESAASEYLALSDIDFDAMEFTCTSFDSYTEVVDKYPESESIIKRLGKYSNVRVLHQINAWELSSHFDTEFDVIIWNHPHLGTEDFRLHRFLMAHFLNSAKSVLSRQDMSVEPKICVSLVEGQETRWSLAEQAKRMSLERIDVLPFEEQDFPGYICKRNKNGQSFKNVHTKKHVGTYMRSFVHRFRRTEVESAVKVLLEIEDPEIVDLCGKVKARLKITPLPGNKVLLFDPVAYKNKRLRKQAPSDATYECPTCHKLFVSLRGIGQHFHQIHGLCKEELPTTEYHCELCDARVFSKHTDLEQHMVNKHSSMEHDENWKKLVSAIPQNEINSNPSEYAFVPCEVCGQAVSGAPGGMHIHLESLKPLIGMKMLCPLKCDKRQFLEIRALEQHFKFCRRK